MARCDTIAVQSLILERELSRLKENCELFSNFIAKCKHCEYYYESYGHVHKIYKHFKEKHLDIWNWERRNGKGSLYSCCRKKKDGQVECFLCNTTLLNDLSNQHLEVQNHYANCILQYEKQWKFYRKQGWEHKYIEENGVASVNNIFAKCTICTENAIIPITFKNNTLATHLNRDHNIDLEETEIKESVEQKPTTDNSAEPSN